MGQNHSNNYNLSFLAEAVLGAPTARDRRRPGPGKRAGGGEALPGGEERGWKRNPPKPPLGWWDATVAEGCLGSSSAARAEFKCSSSAARARSKCSPSVGRMRVHCSSSKVPMKFECSSSGVKA
eukprot:8484062-Pyramimonas_sp.AAC.1